MHFNATADYPASADRVAELFTDPEFVDAKITASRATDGKKTITGGASAEFSIETTRTMPKDLIPSQFQKFLPGGVVLTLVEAWGAPAADGRREGTLALKIAGVPAEATGTCVLENTGPDTSRLTYDGDVKVSIPMFGSRIEKIAVEAVEQVMGLERDVAATWLT